MVSSHSSCIIQSYLQWLSDSDFDPVCPICTQALNITDCVRLPCFCVFHVKCIDAHYSQLPKNTAPAGYKCTKCQDKIFPSLNSGGPMVEQVREKLKSFPWARTGLGMPLLPDVPVQSPTPEPSIVVLSSNQPQKQGVTQRKNVQKSAMPEEIKIDPQHAHDYGHQGYENTSFRPANPASPPPDSIAYGGSSQNQRYGGNQHFDEGAALRPKQRTADADFNAFKYRRRSWRERIRRILHNYRASQKYAEPLMGRGGALIMVGLIALMLIMIWMGTTVSKVRRENSDPMFDPLLNPNIHTSDVNVPIKH